MARKDGYYSKYRTLYCKETKKIREVYSPVIVVNGHEMLVSNGDEILEFNSRYWARKCAKETYLKHKEKLENDLKNNQ